MNISKVTSLFKVFQTKRKDRNILEVTNFFKAPEEMEIFQKWPTFLVSTPQREDINPHTVSFLSHRIKAEFVTKE